MTLDEFSLELEKKYGGCIKVSGLNKKTVDTININGWYYPEELESMVADIKAWQGKQHEQG